MIALALAAALAMTPKQTYDAIRECRALHGMDSVVRKQSGYGKWNVTIYDQGVARVECYLPNGKVQLFAPPVPVSAVIVSCKDQGMVTVYDPKTGAPKCVSRNPPSVIDRLLLQKEPK